MNHDSMISDVKHLLGRIINSQGKPIDERGPISATTHLPLYNLASSEAIVEGSPVSMIEMGMASLPCTVCQVWVSLLYSRR